jgi:hypothetical protein
LVWEAVNRYNTWQHSRSHLAVQLVTSWHYSHVLIGLLDRDPGMYLPAACRSWNPAAAAAAAGLASAQDYCLHQLVAVAYELFVDVFELCIVASATADACAPKRYSI